jgi:hypothetical protein
MGLFYLYYVWPLSVGPDCSGEIPVFILWDFSTTVEMTNQKPRTLNSKPLTGIYH